MNNPEAGVVAIPNDTKVGLPGIDITIYGFQVIGIDIPTRD